MSCQIIVWEIQDPQNMNPVNLKGNLQVFSQCLSTLGPHLCVWKIEGDESRDDTFKKFGSLRAEVIVRQVKDLQVEVGPAFLYDFEVAQALRSDTATNRLN